MFDPDFDPLEDLMQARLTIMQLQQNERVLLGAINEQSQLLKELSLQHKQLASTVRMHSREIKQLKEPMR